jgi:hypothetical protein
LEVLVTRAGATLLRGLADLVITVQEVVLKYYKGRFANTRNRNDKGGFSSIGKKTRKKLALFSAGVSIFLNFSGCSDLGGQREAAMKRPIRTIAASKIKICLCLIWHNAIASKDNMLFGGNNTG